MKKKVIGVILIVVALMLLMACTVVTNPNDVELAGELVYDLVFIDEESDKVGFDEAIKQLEEEAERLEAGEDIARTFELSKFEFGVDTASTVTLDKVYLRTIDLDNSKVDYKGVSLQSIVIADDTILRRVEYGNAPNIILSLNDLEAKEVDTYLSITVKKGGMITEELAEQLDLTFRVVRYRIPVERLEIGLVDGPSIQVGESKTLERVLDPSYASYTNVEYSITEIKLEDGSEYKGNRSDLAYIENKKLIVTSAIPIGAQIYVVGYAYHDDVWSNELCVDVVRKS